MYQNLVTARWIIEAEPDNVIRLCFNDMDLELGFDYISICEGTNITCENPNVLAKYCQRYTVV